jgi:hypothetical protein
MTIRKGIEKKREERKGRVVWHLWVTRLIFLRRRSTMTFRLAISRITRGINATMMSEKRYLTVGGVSECPSNKLRASKGRRGWQRYRPIWWSRTIASRALTEERPAIGGAQKRIIIKNNNKE